MKSYLSLSILLAIFATGCASTANYSKGGVDHTSKYQLNQEPATKIAESELESAAQICPPGTRMATRIISGETGTTITEECVKPFSSRSS